MNNIKFRFFLILGFSPFLISCVNTKSVVLFNELNQSSIASRIEDIEPVIQKNDLLSISVSSLNPEASLIFNTPNVNTSQATSVTANTNYVTGYLVNQDGYIQFPVLGNIKASGLSKKQLRDNISKGLVEGKLLLDPIVNIRYLNYKVTVLGEVARPSVLPIPNEKITLLEALGLAGDLTVYGRRDNILVIRETEGAKVFQRLNLNTNEIFTSPYYYLKSNDIVYVEPNKKKLASVSNASKWVPVFLSGLSAIIVIVDRLVKQ
jgi:polysaccharide export outer membrane protein